MKRLFRGNCYVASEAIYHLLGGKASAFKPMRMKVPGDTHWFLQHKTNGTIIDVTNEQFEHLPDYTKARGSAFLTTFPSKRALELMRAILINKNQ